VAGQVGVDETDHGLFVDEVIMLDIYLFVVLLGYGVLGILLRVVETDEAYFRGRGVVGEHAVMEALDALLQEVGGVWVHGGVQHVPALHGAGRLVLMERSLAVDYLAVDVLARA